MGTTTVSVSGPATTSFLDLHADKRTHSTTMAAGDVIRNRHSAKAFATKSVPEDVLAEVLHLMQRAPSSMNMQPYVVIVLRDQADRDRLAHTMLASNGEKVKSAPVVVVFASDLEPVLNVPRIQQLKRDAGIPPSKIENMPRNVRLFSHHGLGPDAPAPLSTPTSAWSIKQTTFAAATLLYAAQEYGLATLPMEGFMEAQVLEVLQIPERYAVPVIIALGYPEEEAQVRLTPRLPANEVIFEGKFGAPSDRIFHLE